MCMDTLFPKVINLPFPSFSCPSSTISTSYSIRRLTQVQVRLAMLNHRELEPEFRHLPPTHYE
jgi:hypothetical protein